MFVEAQRVREPHEDPADWRDEVDVRLCLPRWARKNADVKRRWLSIETKSKGERWPFSKPADFPFDDVLLYNANKTCRPHAVFIVSEIEPYPIVAWAGGPIIIKKQEDPERGLVGDRAYDAAFGRKEDLLTFEAACAALWKHLH